jgi:hypothetical protein
MSEVAYKWRMLMNSALLFFGVLGIAFSVDVGFVFAIVMICIVGSFSTFGESILLTYQSKFPPEVVRPDTVFLLFFSSFSLLLLGGGMVVGYGAGRSRGLFAVHFVQCGAEFSKSRDLYLSHSHSDYVYDGLRSDAQTRSDADSL